MDIVVAVKEFCGDVRRALEINELAPDIDVIAGADDVLFELLVVGATGWFAGYPERLPGRVAWSSTTWPRPAIGEPRAAVRAHWSPLPLGLPHRVRPGDQARMDMAGRLGGPCRPPRGPLTPGRTAVVERGHRQAGARRRRRRTDARASATRSPRSTRTPRACRPGSSPAASASIPGATMASGGCTSWRTSTTCGSS